MEKMEYNLKLHNELNENYEIITKLVIIALRKNFKLIIENPYSTQHYLSRYWCLKPSVIDKDRRAKGDFFKKPTQYFFVNFKPKNNFIFEVVNNNALNKTIENMTDIELNGKKVSKTVARSMIHSEYANRFIREYIL